MAIQTLPMTLSSNERAASGIMHVWEKILLVWRVKIQNFGVLSLICVHGQLFRMATSAHFVLASTLVLTLVSNVDIF